MPAMMNQAVPSLDDVPKLMLGQVALVAQSTHELRFRVRDPLIYPAYPPFDLVLRGILSFAGNHEMTDVRLRVSDARTIRPDLGADYTLFEFVSDEVVPTEGRPVQVEILAGQSRILYGTSVARVEARAIAESADVVAAPAP